MKAYAQDLREHVLRAVDDGYLRAEIVHMFGISLSTLKRYLKQRRDEGHVKPKAIPGRPAARNGHRWRLVCCPNYRRMTMPHWNNTVRCGSRSTVNK
jgi:transposase